MTFHNHPNDPDTPDVFCTDCGEFVPLWDAEYIDDEPYCYDCFELFSESLSGCVTGLLDHFVNIGLVENEDDDES